MAFYDSSKILHKILHQTLVLNSKFKSCIIYEDLRNSSILTLFTKGENNIGATKNEK